MVDPAAARFLAAVGASARASLRERAFDGPIFDTSSALVDYLRFDMGFERREYLRVLFLSSGNRLLTDEIMAQGTIDEVAIYPREVIRRAIEVGATALILVHNHPSGDAAPSRGDIVATRRLADAARPCGITLHDHLIVAEGGWSSLRALGLL